MKVIAVVVTYNRLALLQECIAALRNQTFSIAEILVINNGSTDGTTEWLNQQTDLQKVHDENKGGTWGFYNGIKNAYRFQPNWIWIMDDDTVPHTNALEKMLFCLPNIHKFGFLASKVIWTDGNEHQMNIQHADTKHPDFTSFQQQDITLIQHSSFVSLLANPIAIEQVGLPIKEFFIWKDDTEFTKRIIKAGWYAGLVEQSVVVHKTAANFSVDMFADSATNCWKYFYGIRNDLYVRKHIKGYGSYVRNIFKNLSIVPIKILLRRKSHRLPYIKQVVKGTFAALSFSPQPEPFNQ
jgi:rhamnopyranosyl-N-acetylglucosaminyl-diphospho-decaprenol beta-1,3/1,4-galactofuranosyltransferase